MHKNKFLQITFDAVPKRHTNLNVFNVFHSVHYNLVITFQTNKRTQSYQDNNNIMKHNFLHVSGLIGPSSGCTQFYKTATVSP